MAKPKRRTTDEIMTEYVQLTARVGELEYRRLAAAAELSGSPREHLSVSGLYLRLYDLNLEHAAAVEAAMKSKPTPSKE